MSGAVILADQPTGAGAGSPGIARNDLWLEREINFSCAESGNTTFLWELLRQPVGSALTMGTPTSSTSSLTPEVVGTYRVRLTTNGGGAGNEQTLVFRVRYDVVGGLANRGWAYPAPDEVNEEANYDSNTRGYAEPFETILEDVRVNLGVGSGGTTTPEDIFAIFDAAEWNEIAVPGGSAVHKALAWDSGVGCFVAITSDGTGTVIRSVDGVTWTAVSSGVTENWKGLTYSADLSLLCAVANSNGGGQEVMTSSNGGVSWVPHTVESPSLNWNAVAWSPELGLFVAVGDGNGAGQNIMRSEDGSTWLNCTEADTHDGTETWGAIVWAPPSVLVPTGQFFAVARGGAFRTMFSLDGITWVKKSSLPDYGNGIAWNGELFVVACGNEGICTSPTGVTWTTQPSSTAFNDINSFYAVVWAPELSLFVAGGNSNYEVGVSKDGITWYPRIIHAPSDNYVISFAWSDFRRTFVAGGDSEAFVLVSRPLQGSTTAPTTGVTAVDEVLTTPDATPATIYSYTPSGNSKLISFQLQLLASNQPSSALFVLAALCKIDSGGTITELDTFFMNGPFRDQPSWDVTVTPSGGSILIVVTGNFDAVDWRVTGTVTEHTLGAGPGA